jgi:hypothetical protein
MKQLVLLLALLPMSASFASAQVLATNDSIEKILSANHGTVLGKDQDHSNSQCALRIIFPGEAPNQSNQTLVAVNSQVMLTSYYYPFGIDWQIDPSSSEVTFSDPKFNGGLILKFNPQTFKVETATSNFQGFRTTCAL